MKKVYRLLTKLAQSSDTMSDDEYVALYKNLRGELNLREFVAKINSDISIAWWSKLDRELTGVTRRVRNELRAAAGIEVLPPTISDVVGKIEPDASAYEIEDNDSRGAFLFLNKSRLPDCGKIDVESLVTTVTKRRERHNVSIRSDIWLELNALRRRKNMTWDQFAAHIIKGGQ